MQVIISFCVWFDGKPLGEEGKMTFWEWKSGVKLASFQFWKKLFVKGRIEFSTEILHFKSFVKPKKGKWGKQFSCNQSPP